MPLLAGSRIATKQFFPRKPLNFKRRFVNFFKGVFDSVRHAVAAKNQINSGFESDIIDQHSKRIVGSETIGRQSISVFAGVAVEIRLHGKLGAKILRTRCLRLRDELCVFDARFLKQSVTSNPFQNGNRLFNRPVTDRVDRDGWA